MNVTEVLDFLLPQAELLQVSFLVLILAMMIFTIATLHLYARPSSWDKKWKGDTPDDHSDDLDVDHGSVTDICNAVATGPEKLAEVMPGLLLVVGLLGTFLGLGLALNHASNILGQPSALSASGAANSMQDLLGLLQGLGTKFKTSTWGIIGFLLLKVWSSITRFEERRLTWAIRKVKAELEQRKARGQAVADAKMGVQFAQIERAANRIVEGFSLHLTQQVGQLLAQDKILHKHTLHYLEKNVRDVRENLATISTTTQAASTTISEFLQKNAQDVRKDLATISTTTQAVSTTISQLLEKNARDVREDLAAINTATQASSAAMVQFASSTQSVIEGMSTAGQRMAEGADQVGFAASQLVNAVDDFKTQFTEVLDNVRTDLGSAISNMSAQASSTLEQGSQQLGNATREISTALGVLSSDVTTTMTGVTDSIKDSLKIQERGAAQFQASSLTLNENVTATTALVEKLGNDIQSGLEAVSASGRRMAVIGKSLENIVPEMVKLPLALQPLGELPTQQKALFLEVGKLRQDFLGMGIRSGVEAVSTSGQHLAGIGKLLQSAITEVDKLQQTLQLLGALPAQQQALLREVQGMRQDLHARPVVLASTHPLAESRILHTVDAG